MACEEASTAVVDPIRKRYRFEKRLGRGTFATVYLATQIVDEGKPAVALKVALKVVHLERLTNLDDRIRQSLFREVEVLRGLPKHPHVVGLIEHQLDVSGKELCLVLEYCNGGDLMEHLNRQEGKRLSLSSTRSLMKQLVKGLRFLRAKEIAHRDLKPQNLLLIDRSPKKTTPGLKIADFGFARELMQGQLAETMCGSPNYMAPELLLGSKYSAKSDLWSVGCILFQMLTGRLPVIASSLHELIRFAQDPEPMKIPSMHPCSDPVPLDLISKLLRKNPTRRIGWDELFLHPFVQKYPPSSAPLPVPLRRSGGPPASSPLRFASSPPFLPVPPTWVSPSSTSPSQGNTPSLGSASSSSGCSSTSSSRSRNPNDGSSILRFGSPFGGTTGSGFVPLVPGASPSRKENSPLVVYPSAMEDSLRGSEGDPVFADLRNRIPIQASSRSIPFCQTDLVDVSEDVSGEEEEDPFLQDCVLVGEEPNSAISTPQFMPLAPVLEFVAVRCPLTAFSIAVRCISDRIPVDRPQAFELAQRYRERFSHLTDWDLASLPAPDAQKCLWDFALDRGRSAVRALQLYSNESEGAADLSISLQALDLLRACLMVRSLDNAHDLHLVNQRIDLHRRFLKALRRHPTQEKALA